MRMYTKRQTVYLLKELCSSSFAADRPNLGEPSNFYKTLYARYRCTWNISIAAMERAARYLCRKFSRYFSLFICDSTQLNSILLTKGKNNHWHRLCKFPSSLVVHFGYSIQRTIVAHGWCIVFDLSASSKVKQEKANVMKYDPPFPQIDIIWVVVIVWRVRGKTIRSVLCNIVCDTSAQCDAHTYEQTISSLDWVLSHWAHFTVVRFIFACIMCIIVYCLHV